MDNNFKNTSEDLKVLDLKKSSEQKFNEAQDEDIYVMPAKFLEKKGKKKNNLVFFGIIFLILIILIGGAIFLFNEKIRDIFFKPVQKEDQKIDNNKKDQNEIDQNDQKNIEIAQTIKAEVKDKDNQVISRAQVTLPFGFTDDSKEKIKIIGQYPSKAYLMIDPQQDIIGGVYTFVPSDIKLKRSITLILGYDDKIIGDYKEKNFRVAFLENGKWNFLEAQQDIENNVFTLTLLDLKDVYAILVPKTKEILTNLDVDLDIINPNILPSTIDSDFDGLTDVEEEFYGTDPQRADSDFGGYPDGWEVINLYSPTNEGLFPLSNTGKIKVYTDQIYRYNIFYLVGFTVNTVDNKVIFTPPVETGESMIIIVQENPEKLKSKEWYTKQFEEKTLDESKLKTSMVDGIEGVWSKDTQTFYLAKDNLIYVFSYNSSLLTHLNFKTTFKMMINSFKFDSKKEIETNVEPVEKNGELPKAIEVEKIETKKKE